MPNDSINLLKSTRIFSSLSEEAAELLLSKFTPTELKVSEVLFHQGDPSNAVYVLLSGRLCAQVNTISGETRTLGYIESGETVGELGVLSKEVRSLTIIALKDSTLLKISSDDFNAACRQYPAIMLAVIHPIMERSSSILQILTATKKDKHIVVMPANKNFSLEEFNHQIFDITAKYANVLIVSSYQEEFRNPDLTSDVIKDKIHAMGKDKKSHFEIIYILGSQHHPLAKFALHHADMIYIADSGKGEAKIDPQVVAAIQKRRMHLRAEPGLVLIYPAGTEKIENTLAWLEQVEFSSYHHVRMNSKKDFQRILRFFRGKAVGVVLGGGGTRGWAHVGAIKALEESRIPIDAIGGTSAGGIVAACYATTNNFEDMCEKFYNIVNESENSLRWRNLTWPAISLFNARSFTNAEIKAFAETRIEDLWVPYFCISCNLTYNTEAIHRDGLLWEKLRASTAIPGIIPPMVINGDIHVDGGLLNNLPVDVMRNHIGHRGRVIAVELNNFLSKQKNYNFPPILTFFDTLLAKFGVGKSKYRFPQFMDVFLQGLFVGSLARSKQNSMAANILVSLELNKFRLLHSNHKEARKMIEIGYRETMKQIHEAKNKKS